MNTKIFIDMDGVAAKWNPNASIEDTYKKGYFRNREADTELISVIERLAKEDYKFCILSAVYNETAAREKLEWLREYFTGVNILDPGVTVKQATDPLYPAYQLNPGFDYSLPMVEVIFCPYGTDKSEFIAGMSGDVNFLLDDFSKNLIEWCKANKKEDPRKFIGIKYMNGINGTKGTWMSHRILSDYDVDVKYAEFKALINFYSKREAA